MDEKSAIGDAAMLPVNPDVRPSLGAAVNARLRATQDDIEPSPDYGSWNAVLRRSLTACLAARVANGSCPMCTP